MIAPIMPYRAFGDMPDSAQALFFRRDAISLLRSVDGIADDCGDGACPWRARRSTGMES